MVSNGKPYLDFFNNDLAGNQPLQSGEGYHLVWRYTKSTGEQAIFVNGVSDAAQSGRAVFTGTDTVYLGRAWTGTAFKGLLDEVQIYGRSLSPDEIAALYRASGPLLWLKLDEPSATDQGILRDASGWGHYAQLNAEEGPYIIYLPYINANSEKLPLPLYPTN